MRLSRTVFREYDVRGRVPEIFPDAGAELSDAGMRHLGRAFGTLLAERGLEAVVVGYDLRSYSERLRTGSSRASSPRGAASRTSLLPHADHLLRADPPEDPRGAMITASHNPQGWSGLKLATDFVTTLGSDDIRRLHAICDDGPLVSGTGSSTRVPIRDAYLDDLVTRVRPARRLKIVLDCGNGTASYFAPEAFRRAGFDVAPLYCDPDPTFPNHFPNPSETKNRLAVRRKVVETGADLGLSFDGDGDPPRRRGQHERERQRGPDPDAPRATGARGASRRAIVFDVKCSQASSRTWWPTAASP
jgi:phosphomannomutase/phosphoglucomutase